MSSSHTYISNSRLRDLERRANRTYNAEQQMQQIQGRAQQREREIHAQYQANQANLQSNITSLSASLSQQRNDMLRANQEFRSRLAQQSAEYQADIQRVGRDIGDINNRMRDINNRVNALDSLSNDHSRRLNELAGQRADERTHANAAIVELSGLLDSIRGLHPEKFAPGELEALTEQRNRAWNSFEQGHYQAALGIAQVRMTDAARLLHRLSMLNPLFNETLSRAREQANEINQRISLFTDGKPSHDFELGGESYKLPYDINYWTGGRFTEVQNQMNTVNGLLENAENDADVDLNRLAAIQQELESLDGKDGYIEALDAFGRTEQIRSFAVGDMAIQVHNALQEQGWNLSDSGRHGEDDRKPYTMIYEDGTGNQVALVVNSGENPENTSVDIEVYVNGEDNRDSVYSREIKDGVEQTIDGLHGEAVTVGRRERRNDCIENPTPQEFIRNTVDIYQQTQNRSQTQK